MPRFSNKLETFEEFFCIMAKRFLVPHWHASIAGMGALTRTAIGIRRKRNERQRKAKKSKENSVKKRKRTKKRIKIMVFKRTLGLNFKLEARAMTILYVSNSWL